MSIKADVQELASLKAEIKTLQAKLKNLRTQAKTVQERITVYLKEKQTPGVKYNGNVVLLEEKEKAGKKANKQKDIDAIKILENHGIQNSHKVLEEIMKARKGEPEMKVDLKFQKIKNQF
jgi:ribulose-5-phosphate 4-epimerase/fuculose-1-phosphate aldolase